MFQYRRGTSSSPGRNEGNRAKPGGFKAPQGRQSVAPGGAKRAKPGVKMGRPKQGFPRPAGKWIEWNAPKLISTKPIGQLPAYPLYSLGRDLPNGAL